MAALALILWQPRYGAVIRNNLFDLYQRCSSCARLDAGSAGGHRRYAIDAWLAVLGQWPWPRTRVAEIISRLTEDGAAAIAFDGINPRTGPHQSGSALAAALLPGGPVRGLAGVAPLADFRPV